MEEGCEDTYNDNLWGTNCNNLVYTQLCAAARESLMDEIALITVLPEE